MDLQAARASLVELNKAAKSLGDALAAVPPRTSEDIEALLKVVRIEMDKVVAAVGGTKTNLSDFMGDVGKSLVSVQKQLDRQSDEYNRLAAASPELKGIAQPTAFRVPRVNASIKFAMSTESSRKVGLLFFASTEAAKSAHQQSVDFEIAAVPAPPEVVRSLAGGGQLLSLVLAADEREAVRAEGLKLASTPAGTKGERDLKFLASKFGADGKPLIDSARVLMVRTAYSNPMARRWVIALLTSPPEEKRVGVWAVTLEKDKDAKWDVLYSRVGKPAAAEDESALWDILDEVARWQSDLVEEFRPG